MNKYYIKTLKEVRTVKEFEIEAETLKEARNIVRDLAEEDDEEGNILMEDCSNFEILEAYQINN